MTVRDFKEWAEEQLDWINNLTEYDKDGNMLKIEDISIECININNPYLAVKTTEYCEYKSLRID